MSTALELGLRNRERCASPDLSASKLNGVRRTLPDLVFISLGSNIKPEVHLTTAVQRLHELGSLIGLSTVYQNPAIGPTQQPDFLNAAALIETDLEIDVIHNRLRRIEADLGRVRTEDKSAPRTIDLDLCLVGDLVIETPQFTLPDPGLLTLAHLAIPIAELAPDYLHPITGESLKDIADRLRPSATLLPQPEITARLSIQ